MLYSKLYNEPASANKLSLGASTVLSPQLAPLRMTNNSKNNLNFILIQNLNNKFILFSFSSCLNILRWFYQR